MSDVTLTSGIRSNLLALQQTSNDLTTTQEALATGKKVNSAADNPSSYFTSQNLTQSANSLSALLDQIGQGSQTINYATKISTDGIYLHQLDATVWAQGHTDTSHGCLNLNADNAKWFYGFSVPGDVVEIRNSGGPPLRLAQNGDWTLSWDQWRQGSALKPAS